MLTGAVLRVYSHAEHMNALERDQNLRVRMLPVEKQMLQELADAAGMSASDVVRQLIRREHAKVIGSASSAPPSKPRKSPRSG